MAKIFQVDARHVLARVVEPIARGLLRVGVSANAVTIAGSVGVAIGSFVFATRGHFIIALFIVTICALTDLLDGTMARLAGSTGKWGALLDSTVDRLSDSFVFMAIIYWYAAGGDNHRALIATALSLVLGSIVSYIKARAEGLGFSANVGIAERAERLLVVGVGGLATGLGFTPGLEIAMWILTALAAITIWQRGRFVYKQAVQPKVEQAVQPKVEQAVQPKVEEVS
jgi:CDP-diacylglycerol--glycerol-3-phosphate 3-phosphatidyltransferase